ncbi:MAG: sugar kinase [Deltaproteobacteria bacterium]|nr:sugar kinase [Deltaproteobacteria bacterium]
MSIVVVGTLAFDSIQTPFGRVERILGGSANHFSMAAHYFTSIKMVGVIGDDFPQEHLMYLTDRKICTKGIQKIRGKSFFWEGLYESDMNQAKTLITELNVLEQFNPILPADYRQSDCLFLANFDPELQLSVLDQVGAPSLVACDTMNFWIERKREALEAVLKRIHLLLLNEGEAKLLTGESNLIRAIKKMTQLGPKMIIIKRGEYGAMLYFQGTISILPAYPLEEVRDPTGAGDAFAGGVMGYLAKHRNYLNEHIVRRAMMYGTVMASFNIEDFSFNRLKELSWKAVEERYLQLKQVISL